MTIKRTALLFLAIASPTLLATSVLPGSFSQYLFAILVMGYPVALIAFAVARPRRMMPLVVPLLALLVILEASVVAMLVLRGRVLDGPWIGGLPAAAAVLLYGLWLSPLLLVAVGYALTFDRFEMREEDLERLDRVGRDVKEGG